MKKYILWFFLLFLIILGLLLISRGLSMQRVEENESLVLRDSILYHNKIVSKDSGLYKESNRYVFKGEDVPNYINIFNRVYRILSIEENIIRLVSSKNEGVFFYGSGTNYINSNIYMWLNKGENEFSGVYADSIDDFSFLEKNDFDTYFSILDLDSYNEALGKNSYLNNGESSFILDENQNVLLKEEDGSIVEEVSASTSGGVRVVLNLKSNVTIDKGDGSYKNPFVIYGDNYINKYVKLGEDRYQIFYAKDDLLKLRKEEALAKKQKFSNQYSGFKPLNKNNIAYFLNTTYYDDLSYKKYLKTCDFYTGDVMDSYNYFSIYNSKISAKVGLLNVFDLQVGSFLDDYYFVNTSKENHTLSFSYDKFGHIVENESVLVKKILPVVCIHTFDIIDGDGSENKPYILEK